MDKKTRDRRRQANKSGRPYSEEFKTKVLAEVAKTSARRAAFKFSVCLSTVLKWTKEGK